MNQILFDRSSWFFLFFYKWENNTKVAETDSLLFEIGWIVIKGSSKVVNCSTSARQWGCSLWKSTTHKMKMVKCLPHHWFTTYPETGDHRHVQLCGRKFITGPRKDFNVQVLCLMLFVLAWIGWIIFTGVFVGQTNVLLALVVFVSLLVVSWKQCSWLVLCYELN